MHKITTLLFADHSIEVNNGKESDSMEKIKKQSNPKVMNLF